MDFPLLVKPASADCNLRCAYCFYLDRQEMFPAPRRMNRQTLETMIAGYMPTQRHQASFIWQGGEPTMMGIDFFKEVIRLQQVHGRHGQRVVNSLQTNATLIDHALAEHFGRYLFLLGVSLDGPAEVHDRYRRTIGGRGSHRKVLRGMEILNRHGVEFNVLCLVTAQSTPHAAELLAYYHDLGIYHLQFVPCVEFDPRGQPLPFSLSARQWGDFLCNLFDTWWRRGPSKTSIRLFDDLLVLIANGRAHACHLDENCGNYLVVEHDGNVYPCDFFVDPDKVLGNVHTHSLAGLASSRQLQRFGEQKSKLARQCSQCAFRAYCRGDCLKHRAGRNSRPETPSWLCQGWKAFFAHALPRLHHLAHGLPTSTAARPKPGRNTPCPCGSGHKYKKCCLQTKTMAGHCTGAYPELVGTRNSNQGGTRG